MKSIKRRTYEEMYGKERAKEIRGKMSNSIRTSKKFIKWKKEMATDERFVRWRKEWTSFQRGKTYEDIYGEERGQELRKKTRKAMTKANRTRMKGKTYEEIYGKEKAAEIRRKISSAKTGQNMWENHYCWKGGTSRHRGRFLRELIERFGIEHFPKTGKYPIDKVAPRKENRDDYSWDAYRETLGAKGYTY